MSILLWAARLLRMFRLLMCAARLALIILILLRRAALLRAHRILALRSLIARMRAHRARRALNALILLSLHNKARLLLIAIARLPRTTLLFPFLTGFFLATAASVSVLASVLTSF